MSIVIDLRDRLLTKVEDEYGTTWIILHAHPATVRGHSRHPAPTLVVAAIAARDLTWRPWSGILGELISIRASGSVFGAGLGLPPKIVLVGAIPAIAMIVMLLKGAPLFPHLAVTLGAPTVATLGNVGLRLFHPADAS